jgi:rhamnose transport system permease protein
MKGERDRPYRRPTSILAVVLPAILLAAAVVLVFSRLQHPTAVYPLWRPWAEVGALACGMTAVMVSGGIDLSVGAMIALCGVVLGLSWQRLGWPVALASGAAVLTGALAGAVNGSLIALGIAPLVATLATMAFYSGLALALSRGERITGFPEGFARLGQGDLLGLPCQLWLLLGTALAWGMLLHLTRFGRTLYAVGDNRTAAEFAALPVRRRLWRLYALNGLLAGIVAVSYTARGGAAVPNAAAGLELPVIAAVVLGGTRVTGGAGGIARTLLGVAILAHLEIGLRLLGNMVVRIPGTAWTLVLNANSRLVVMGVLLVAVAVVNERLANPRQGR